VYSQTSRYSAKSVIDHNVSLINLAEAKASILLTLNGVVLALLFEAEKVALADFTKLLLLITGLCSGASSIFTVFAIIPRLTKESQTTKIYFKKIAEMERNDFVNSWNSLTDSDILNDYLRNIHNLAVIQQKKFLHLQRSIIANIIGIGFLVAALFSSIL